MIGGELRTSVRDLLADTGRAHHKAFEAVQGEDPEWPIWYADYLQQPLGSLLEADFTKSRLIYCLMFVEFEREARAPEADWAGYYADHLVERFAPAAEPAEDKLVLYHFPSCPFCARVRRVVEEMGLDVELRDIHTHREYRDELVQARGRSTVPVLRITEPDGEERWMPESQDIMRYLKTTYG